MTAETQKQIETTVAEFLDMERQLQKHERILDQLWETVHPGQEQDDDAEPEELAAQICAAWAELGRAQLENEAKVVANLERAHDGLSELQRAVQAAELAQDDADTRGLLEHGPMAVAPLERLLERWASKAVQEETQVASGVFLQCSQELAALMVRHCAPPAGVLLGGMAPLVPVEEG